MNCKLFGDSYDIVKRGMLQWLSPCGNWSAHPMFTDPDPTEMDQPCQRFNGKCREERRCGHAGTFQRDYGRFLGVQIVNDQICRRPGVPSDRKAWLSAAEHCQDHLFLDPNTGVPFDTETGCPRTGPGTGNRPNKAYKHYLMADELATIADCRASKLTLVFDQSINFDGDKTEQVEAKLRWFRHKRIYGFVYRSHAAFLLVSKDRDMLAYAKAVLLASSKIPNDRLIKIREY